MRGVGFESLLASLEREPNIDKKLAVRHTPRGGLVLYDVSSSYFEGSSCLLMFVKGIPKFPSCGN